MNFRLADLWNVFWWELGLMESFRKFGLLLVFWGFLIWWNFFDRKHFVRFKFIVNLIRRFCHFFKVHLDYLIWKKICWVSPQSLLLVHAKFFLTKDLVGPKGQRSKFHLLKSPFYPQRAARVFQRTIVVLIVPLVGH